jgi:hypothetical protein
MVYLLSNTFGVTQIPICLKLLLIFTCQCIITLTQPYDPQGDDIEGGANQQAWAKWSNDGTEQQVAKLMEEDVGAAMQLLQSKALCIMPISLASAIFRMPQSDTSTIIKPESNNSHS